MIEAMIARADCHATGFSNVGFSARYMIPSSVSRTSTTPPPSSYIARTKPARSNERTVGLYTDSGIVSGLLSDSEMERSTFFCVFDRLIFSIVV